MGLGKIIPNTGLYELATLHGYNTGEAGYELQDPDGAPIAAPAPFIWVALSEGTTTPGAEDIGPETELNNPVYSRKRCVPVISEVGEGDSYAAQNEYTATFEPGEIIDDGLVTVNGISLMNSSTTGVPYFLEVRNPILFDNTLGAIIKIRCTFARQSEV